MDRTKEYSFVLSTMPRLHACSMLLDLGVLNERIKYMIKFSDHQIMIKFSNYRINDQVLYRMNDQVRTLFIE